MKFQTRDRLLMVARPVFTLGSITGLVVEKFLKMMPLTLFWVSIAASLYLDVSFSTLFAHPQSLIKFSMLTNVLLAVAFSIKQISNTIDVFYAAQTGGMVAGKSYAGASRSE
ncbi:hypothetical protein ABLV18_27655 [Klebsiella sp. CN_Kp114]|uniref:hypothetical protein n=1 Tax=unclassified Klebsiella TaxID=2608929 RepID=UPI0032B55BCD